MFTNLLQAGQAAGAQGQGGMLMSVLPFLLIIVIFYVFIIRPQNKKQKETQKMIDALKKGDKIVTIGGIHGTVTRAEEKTIIVKVDGGTTIEFNRSAVASVLNAAPVKAEKTDKKAKNEEVKPQEEVKAADTAETVSENSTEA